MTDDTSPPSYCRLLLVQWSQRLWHLICTKFNQMSTIACVYGETRQCVCVYAGHHHAIVEKWVVTIGDGEGGCLSGFLVLWKPQLKRGVSEIREVGVWVWASQRFCFVCALQRTIFTCTWIILGFFFFLPLLWEQSFRRVRIFLWNGVSLTSAAVLFWGRAEGLCLATAV